MHHIVGLCNEDWDCRGDWGKWNLWRGEKNGTWHWKLGAKNNISDC